MRSFLVLAGRRGWADSSPLAVPVLYTISAGRSPLRSGLTEGRSAFDFIDIGVWVCAVGAALAIIGASLLPRREIVTERSRQVEY
ncbi:MAG: hypothetical protein WKF58_18720 [Ilumatobacteraceae bacterium]